jgi:hypothetical protein
MMSRLWFLVLVAAACAQQPPQQQPYAYGDPYAQPPWAGGDAAYACTDVATEKTRGSLCVATTMRCEDERRRAAEGGASAEPCRPQAPVACFDARNDPARELCAASVEDCELLRLIDQDKNGVTGAACEWRHGPR